MRHQPKVDNESDQFDLSSAEFKSAPRSRADKFEELKFNVPREIEAKYFITRQALENEVDLGKLEHQRISQSFIPRSLLAEAVHVVKEHGLLKSLPEKMPFDVSYARIRRVKEGDERIYFFTIKGPKDANLARAEIEVEIPKSLYRELMPLATDGTVKKDRYILPGSTWNEDKHRVSLTKGAEIDIITHLGSGNNFRRLSSSETQFALVDVEFRSAAQRNHFHDGHHTLRFLKLSGIELSPTDSELGKYLTMRYMGRNGVDRNVQEALEDLFSEYKRDLIRLKKAA